MRGMLWQVVNVNAFVITFHVSLLEVQAEISTKVKENLSLCKHSVGLQRKRFWPYSKIIFKPLLGSFYSPSTLKMGVQERGSSFSQEGK